MLKYPAAAVIHWCLISVHLMKEDRSMARFLVLCMGTCNKLGGDDFCYGQQWSHLQLLQSNLHPWRVRWCNWHPQREALVLSRGGSSVQMPHFQRRKSILVWWWPTYLCLHGQHSYVLIKSTRSWRALISIQLPMILKKSTILCKTQFIITLKSSLLRCVLTLRQLQLQAFCIF